MTCSNCGTENPPGRKFCRECGAALAVPCPNCGTPNSPDDKFCGECGTSLAGGPAVPAASPARPAPAPTAPVSERRLVSVLFADLVGFTTISEARDPDEVRDLLSRYFDLCRRVITRYGGTVEKFIGDAVMAVWGTPVAQEDDAERALRAALDLVGAVKDLGRELGTQDLRARAGVMTGEAAVTLGAEGQGMVAGDLVNTASRVQALAEPGTVLVGEATRRATEAAVVYEPAGTHELKGKADPVALYRATRVIGGRQGALRSQGLEAPFVGRDRELRLVKDALHAVVDERKAHLLQVLGVAGIGKSRLGWELYKYIDGLADVFLWHRGRCLAYGEGVTYWALAEMVRGRAGILEAEEPHSAAAKLDAILAEHLPDPDERAWVEPRLAHLLGLEERTAREPEDLFSAWRVFFERLAERNPVVVVFEDMQWADRSLLDFVDYLLNWSRNHPIFVMALARPEVADRHPEWAAPRRGTTTLHLEPLAEPDMHRLLTGLIPGIPEALERQILDRAEGVPLYAMETVRMLLDRGLLELAPDGAAYRLTGPVETLEVPETLHALIAARLDGLDRRERSLLQDAAVVGKTFTTGALSALGRLPEAEVEPLLASLVRKEVLFVQADPRSPERGQYSFLQDLVRRVAYETLSKTERKARHLAAARHIEDTWGGEEVEIVEVVASHYLEAYRSAPEAPDAAEIKARARDALLRAGHRSQSLAAPHLAYGYYQQAIELTDDAVALAELHELAGDVAFKAGWSQQIPDHFDRAIDLFEREGRSREAARVVARFGDVAFADGRFEEAGERMQQAFEVLSKEPPDETLATLAMQMARVMFFSGRKDEGFEKNELALSLAEKLRVPEVLVQALNTKGIMLWNQDRREEALLLVRHALEVALDHELYWAALRAYNNLAALTYEAERFDESLRAGEDARNFARKLGYRAFGMRFLAADIPALISLGRWDEAQTIGTELEAFGEEAAGHQLMALDIVNLAEIPAHRGEHSEAERFLARFASMERAEEVQTRNGFIWLKSLLAAAAGRPAEALQWADRALEDWGVLSITTPGIKFGVVEAVEAAIRLGNEPRAEDILRKVEVMYPGQVTPFVRASVARLRAKLEAARGEHEGVENRLLSAERELRALPMPFWLGVTLLEHAEWLTGQGRASEAEPLLAEARQIFTRLRARPWLERLDAVATGGASEAPVARA